MTTTDNIIEWVVGFNEWCEKNKQEFIKKSEEKREKLLMEQRSDLEDLAKDSYFNR